MGLSVPAPLSEHGILYALALAASQAARVTVFLSEVEPRSAPLIPPDNLRGGVETPREAVHEDVDHMAGLIQARGGARRASARFSSAMLKSAQQAHSSRSMHVSAISYS